MSLRRDSGGASAPRPSIVLVTAGSTAAVEARMRFWDVDEKDPRRQSAFARGVT